MKAQVQVQPTKIQKPQRYVNKVRADETSALFEQKVLKLLNLRSLPAVPENCSWENIYNVISTPGKSMADHLSMAVAHQDLCLTTVVVQSGGVPSESVIASAATGDIAVLRALLSSPGAKVPYQALLNAVDGNKKESVALLLQDKRAPIIPVNQSQPNLLATAVKKNYTEIVRLLLQDDRVDPSGSDNKALYTAAFYNNVPMIRLLLEAGADPNLKDSPFVAATVGNIEAVQYLLHDPLVDKSAIPVRVLRLTENNRGANVTQHTVNRELPPKNKEVFNLVAEALNTSLYGDKIAGIFLGYYLAMGTIDQSVIHTNLTGRSVDSKFLRYLALERHSLKDAVRWLTDNLENFTFEERQAVGEAGEGLRQGELRGDIPISAFLQLVKGLTFQEIFDEVARRNYGVQITLMTAMLLGAHFGFEGSLSSGIGAPPISVLDEADQYTRKTNFAVMRPLN